MELFIQEKEKVYIKEGFLKETSLNGFPEKRIYQGREYSLYEVYVRSLKIKDRMLVFLECLGKTLISLGEMLFSVENLKEKWKLVFSGKEILTIYRLEKKFVRESIHPSLINPNPIDSENPVKFDDSSSRVSAVEKTIVKENIQEVDLNAPLAFPECLKKMSMEEGVNLVSLKGKDKEEADDFFKIFSKKWNHLKNEGQSWTLDVLSEKLKVEKEDLSNLFYRLQIFEDLSKSFHSDVLDWLCESAEDVLKDGQIAKFHPAPNMIWKAAVNCKAKQNRFQSRVEQKLWSLIDLSMFLAVKQESLKEALSSQGVNLNKEGFYQKEDLNQFFKYISKYRVLNNLQKSAIQKKSLRFATDRVSN